MIIDFEHAVIRALWELVKLFAKKEFACFLYVLENPDHH
jgi:hypothetical protein